MKKRKFVYFSTPHTQANRYVLRLTAGGAKLNFWYDNGKHIYFYTFAQNEKYNRNTIWTEAECENLINELSLPNPCVKIVRFAVDGAYFVNLLNEKGAAVPVMPGLKEKLEFVTKKAAEAERLESLRKRAEFEAKKCKTPAPYILYGKFDGNPKEYAWRLTPDKEKRKGIQSGDSVLVWTRSGWKIVTVIRVEPSNERAQPTCRVKKKIVNEEL